MDDIVNDIGGIRSDLEKIGSDLHDVGSNFDDLIRGSESIGEQLDSIMWGMQLFSLSLDLVLFAMVGSMGVGYFFMRYIGLLERSLHDRTLKVMDAPTTGQVGFIFFLTTFGTLVFVYGAALLFSVLDIVSKKALLTWFGLLYIAGSLPHWVIISVWFVLFASFLFCWLRYCRKYSPMAFRMGQRQINP